MDKKLVLVAEDNPGLRRINCRALELEGYRAVPAATLREARERLWEEEPDVIILDVLLPDGSGLDFCREIRGRTAAPILFLTSMTGYDEALAGLRAGGDDYLGKPYDIKLLLTRVAAFLRRDEIVRRVRTPERRFTRGPLTLDTVAQQAFLDGADLLLTPKEFATLLYLARSGSQARTAAQIYREVWQATPTGDARAVRTVISRLRAKLAGSACSIITGRGDGYEFDCAE